MLSPAHELAAAIRERRRSASEVVEEHLARIARLNPRLNAIVTLDADGARSRAREADAVLARGELWGPLHGVPVTIKDTLETAGLRTTAGFAPLADHVPARDATVVTRVRAAGAVILGKTNVPPLAMDYQCANPIFGRTNNPWNVERAPGGSTGGGAAAVAAGLTPLEIGSDIGGSVRTPAHYCGVVSLKPTEHRVPGTGHIPELPGAPHGVRHMGVMGPIARSVEDLALALGVIAGPDGRDWEVPPVGLEPPPTVRLAGCRILVREAFADLAPSRDTRAALDGLVAALRGVGCRVDRLPADALDAVVAWEVWGELLQSEIGSGLTPEMEAAQTGELGSRRDAPDPILRGLARGVGASLRQYTALLTRRDALIARLEDALAGADALLCPVGPCPAIVHCRPGTAVPVDDAEVAYLAAGVGFTSPFNVTGSPVVVLPAARSRDGLPIGVQLVGRRWGEARLLGVAAAVARLLGPFPAPPEG